MSQGAAPATEPGLGVGWIAALILVPVAMLLFALFAFKPLYRLWCQASGTALRPNVEEVATLHGVHTGRYVKVYFGATVDDHLPVRFEPEDRDQMVEIGMDARNTYHIENLSDHVVSLRPVHYISPINASRRFGMKVCFCFNDQVLQPHERRSYPVVFLFAPDLDSRIHTVNLCYELFALGSESDESLNRRIETTIGARGAVVSPRIRPAAVPPEGTPAATASEIPHHD